MQELLTWRELLGQSIENLHERQRISSALGVNPVTLMRWVRQESNPRQQHLRRLLEVLEPRELLLTLIRQEFKNFSSAAEDDLLASVSTTIPVEFYARVMHTRATLSADLQFWSLCDLILRQALQQLDPHRLGMAIMVVRCMPPTYERKVRSLREVMGCGTPPWKSSLDQDLILLGAESLAGYAVSEARLVENQHLGEQLNREPGYRSTWEESAVAAPIMFASSIAGCLLVSSAEPDYFVTSRSALTESYAELIALAFDRAEFFEPQQIALGVVPPFEMQKPFHSGFRQRVIDIMTHALRNKQSMTSVQAEQIAWQELEEKLLEQPSNR
jgi:hypothetical protein